MSLVAPISLTADTLYRLGIFTPYLNSEFTVQRGAEWVSLTLAEAKDYSRPALGDASQTFSLIFASTPEKPLQQGTHGFQHPALGSFELFIVPVQCPHADLRWYEAVINCTGTL